MMPSNEDWLTTNIRRIISKFVAQNNLDNYMKQGWIETAYISGKPRVRFIGDDVPGLKQYPYLSTYQPMADDHVLLARVGKTYVILGKISE